MRRRTFATLTAAFAATLITGAPGVGQASPAATAAISVPGYEFSLIGEHRLSGRTRYQDTRVGGFTGLDYDPATGDFRLLSDDRTNARFYTGRIDLSGAHCARPTTTGVSKLKQANGKQFPGVDPQALRFDAATGEVLWADAGRRSPASLVDPAVRVARPNGSFVSQYATPDVLKVGTAGVGPKSGQSLSGLALTGDGQAVLSAVRGPLLQDGDATRLTLQDRATGELLVQFAYRPDAVAGNGIGEILLAGDSRFLVLEQAGANSAKLYEIDFAAGATNVGEFPALAGVDYLPIAKRLVLDLSQLGLGSVDDIEGVTWGPTLPSGERTLVFVSDNGLDAAKSTQFIAVK
ncbi:esterase-like activity of phytase family protein, partial [Umezawaea sp. NPDC059074]|uniref:esterase-like activity of phytase family protein n=1 Tax=Umezawaea sp. NPDC059074 TaxID=3346716 RepID=UPI003684ACB0